MKTQRSDEPIDIFEDEDLRRAREILSSTSTSNESEVDCRPPLDTGADANERSDAEEAGVRGGVEGVPAEPTDAHVKIRVRRETRSRFDSFKAELSAALGGARLMDSNLGRAVLDWLLFEIGDEVLEAARESAEELRRPASDDLAGMAAFDNALRAIIARAANERKVV